MAKGPGRPPKRPDERQAGTLQIGLTADETTLIERAAAKHEIKAVAWARDVLLKAAKRTVK
jgi:hypothetical protein